MRLRRLEIERFRCIRSLDWKHVGDTVGLVGAGDSGKSTVLEAIERLLSPRWNHPFDDTDFYNLDTTTPLRLRATLVDLPPSFYKDTKFGLALHAFDSTQCLAVPPTGADDEPLCIVLELVVEAGLEPQWQVVDSLGQPHPIQARDRESLGMLRVGSNTDFHLAWNRGSVLTRLTETGDAVAAVLAEATRKARAGLSVTTLDRLRDAALKVSTLGKSMGAAIRADLLPHLDVGSLTFNGSSLSLHDGGVPLRRSGLGTRRLVSVAMQQHVAGPGGITLFDEFEHGLEPHRIRQLLRKLRGLPPETAGTSTGQLVATTHSPVVVSELSPHDIAVVRRLDDGTVTIQQAPDLLRRIVTHVPSALLARRVIVAEGPTEVGLLQTVEESWSTAGDNFAYSGTAIVDGEGQNAPAIAGHLHDLGFEVALFMDQDKPGAQLSRAKGATQVLWPKGKATEDVLAEVFTDSAFGQMVELAHRSPKVAQPAGRPIRDALAARAGMRPAEIGDDLASWRSSIANLRTIFGATAKDKQWFKTLEMGAALGRIVAQDVTNVPQSPLSATLEALRVFARNG